MTTQQRVLDSLPAAVVAYDASGVITLAGGCELEALNLESAVVVGTNVLDHFEGDLRDAAEHALDGDSFATLIQAWDKQIECTFQPVFEQGVLQGVVLHASDVTAREVALAKLAHQAMHDVLTGLPNRALLSDRLEQAVKAGSRSGASSGLLLVDLDGFKQVNDALGHQAGDELLTQLAPRLMSVVRDVDTVARLGGDEFAILLPDTDAEGAKRVADAIQRVLTTPFVLEGTQVVSVGASIGLALYPQASDVRTLMRHADVAMYTAKRGRVGILSYHPDLDVSFSHTHGARAN